MKNVRVANLTTNTKGFFTQWLKLTSPFHNLAQKEQDVLSLLLYYHYDVKKEVKSNKLVWKLVFDYDTKLKIREELGIKDSALQNVLTSLRKKKAIKSNQVHPNYIPVLSDNAKRFQIAFNISIDDK